MPSLADFADHPAIIFPAYIAAFIPLTVLYALDFITEKWKTVGHTRRTGHIYLLSSFPPLCFVVFYIHVQHLANDYKEMAAAMSAAIFCIFHILRTLWGLMQLDAFKQWNMRALRCLNNMGYEAPVYELVSKNRHVKDGDDWSSSQRSTRNSDNGSTGSTGTSDLTGNSPERETCTRTTQARFATAKSLALSAFNYLLSIFKLGDRCLESQVNNETDNESGGEPETCTQIKQAPFAKIKKILLSAFNLLVSIFKRADKYKESEQKKISLSDHELGVTVDNHMLVNSSLVDNEFRGAELPCRLKKPGFRKAVRELLTQGILFRLSDHVECGMPMECSLRWIVVFLARFGSQWLTEKHNLGMLDRGDLLPLSEQKKMFRRRVGAAAALKTTFGEGSGRISVLSPGSPMWRTLSTQEGLRLTVSERAGLPYMCSGYKGHEDISFEGMSSSVREVILGLDRRAMSVLGSAQRNSVEEMSSYQIACFAKMMSSSFPESCLLPADLRRMTVAKQTGGLHTEDTKSFDAMLPINPASYLQSLWTGRFTNKLVDQACVHIDNWAALESGRRLKRITSPDIISNTFRECGRATFHGHKTLEMLAYEYDFSRDETVETRAAWDVVFVGCVMESVRAFMADGVSDGTAASIKNINWRPTIDKTMFPMECSRQLLNCLRDCQNGSSAISTDGESWPRAWDIETRLLWELQLTFHNAVSSNGTSDVVGTNELMALCILGFPSLEVTKVPHTAEDQSPSECQDTMHASDTVLNVYGNGQNGGCDTERVSYSVKPVNGPQLVSLIVSVGVGTGIGEVQVVVGESGTTSNFFEWQAWKDAFMGRLQGQAEWRENMVGPEGLRPRQEALESILSSPVEAILSDVRQWGGWPPFYPEMSMISRRGSFDHSRYYDESLHVEHAMDFSDMTHADGIGTTASEETAVALRAQAQTSKREGRSWLSMKILGKCIEAHNDSAALDELLVLLRENGDDFVKKHIRSIFAFMSSALSSTIESSRKQNAGRDRSYSANIRLDQLSLCASALHEMCPTEYFLAQFHLRCLFELRDPKILPILQEYRVTMKRIPYVPLLASVFCFDQWKSSGESYMRLLGEGYLEMCALQGVLPLSIGYLFEKGILRGRQSYRSRYFRCQIGSSLSVEETACHFVAHSSESVHVVRKSTATAVRIYERSVEEHGKDRDVLNRLGLVYLLDNGAFQNLERSEVLLTEAKSTGLRDAMCNLAVLHGFHYGKWDIAEQNLCKALRVRRMDKDKYHDRPLRSYCFNRPVPENFLINGHVYKMWNRSDICENPHTSSMNNLAVLYEMEDNIFGDVLQALELYEGILAIDENPIALFNMAVLLRDGPAEVRDETRSERLLQTLQSRLPDNEHMPVLAKSVGQLRTCKPIGTRRAWTVAVDELDDCAVLVKQFDEHSWQDERT